MTTVALELRRSYVGLLRGDDSRERWDNVGAITAGVARAVSVETMFGVRERGVVSIFPGRARGA